MDTTRQKSTENNIRPPDMEISSNEDNETDADLQMNDTSNEHMDVTNETTPPEMEVVTTSKRKGKKSKLVANYQSLLINNELQLYIEFLAAVADPRSGRHPLPTP